MRKSSLGSGWLRTRIRDWEKEGENEEEFIRQVLSILFFTLLQPKWKA